MANLSDKDIFRITDKYTGEVLDIWAEMIEADEDATLRDAVMERMRRHEQSSTSGDEYV